MSRKSLFLFTLAMIISVTISAATKTWNGGTGTGLNWTTGSNWVGGVAPVVGDDIIFNTPGVITFSTIPNNISYNSITISQGTVTLARNNATTLTLGGNAGTDFTVANGASLIIGTNVNITLANNATADISGKLIINTGRTYNTNGTSVVTTVNGSIINNGMVTSNTAAKLLFNSGSVFQFANNNANIPIATWDVNSTCNITGYTNPSANPPGYQTYYNQSFGNVIWNCTGQTVAISLGGVLKTINGNFTMTSTGTGSLSMGVTGIGNIFIGGNYTQTGGYLYVSGYNLAAAGATRTIDVTGDFSMSGGTFNLSSTNVATNFTTLNVGGNFSHTSGTITETGSSTASAIRFVSSASPHVYTSGGIVANTVNYIVNSGATLQMGTAASPAIISGGNGSFTLQSGATLGVTHSVGISATGTNTGNIQVTGARSYSSGNINYMGNVAQATGNGLTAAANVSITNTAGVTFTVQAAVSGNISMATGTTANLGTGFTHTASSLTLGSTNEPINNTYGGNSSPASQKRPVFFPNTATGIISLGTCIAGSWTGATSTDWHTASNWCSGTVPTAADNVVIISGTNEPIISAAAECNNITINPGATVTLSGTNTLNVSGNFNNNGSFTTNAGTLTVAGTYTNGTSFYLNTGTLVLNNSSTSAFTNNGFFTAGTGTVNFNAGAQTAVTPSQTLFYNVIIGGTGLKTINAANFVVLGTLSMEATGTISALPTYGNQATLQYNKPAAFTASVEWPATFSPAGGVVVKNTGVITLNQNKTFSNAPLTVFDGATLAMSTFTITNPNALNLKCGGASAGASITGSGLLTLGGDVFVSDANNGAAGATVSCPIALTAGASRVLNVEDDGTTAVDLTLSGLISTTGALIKEGAGTVTLSGNNTFSGGVTLNAGTININNTSALGTVAGTFTINGGSIDNTTAGSITTNNHPLILNNDFSYVGSLSRDLNLGTGAVTVNSDIDITVSAGKLTIGGIINDDTKSFTKSGTGTLSFGGNDVTLNNVTINAGTLVAPTTSLNVAGNFTNSAAFTHSSGTVTFNGTGAQTIISGGSSFNNFTITNTGGTCTASTNDITVAGTFTTNTGTTLDMATNALSVNTVSHAGTLLTQNTSSTPITSGKTWGGTVNYNGSSAQTAILGTYNNLTIASTGGATASGDITVNGILNLAAANASATKGALEMVTNYGNYPRTNGTNQYVAISSYTLTMGSSSTTTGQGDVTGKIYRSTLVANTPYSFGSQYTTYAFTVAPDDVTVIVTIGTAYGDGSTWGNTAAVKRSYEMVPTGGTNAQVTMNLHYLESELNGNTEDQLTTGDFDVDEDGGSEDGAPLGDEHGRSSYDYTNNYIGLNGVPISYFIRTSSHKWYTIFNLHNFSTGHTIWDGSASTEWETDVNWSNGVPGPSMTAIIPDASSTDNDPILAAGKTIGGLQILAGGYMNFDGQTLTICPATYGNGLEDQSGTSNYTGSTVVFSNTGWSTPVMGIPHFDNLMINTGASATASLNSHIFISGTLTKNGGFDASTFDNTIEYNGESQTVVLPDGNTYSSLILSGSGTKTLPAADLTMQNDFTLSGTAIVAPTNALTVGGDFTLGGGTTFTAGSLIHNIAGDFINNGSTFTNTGSTINLNGVTEQTIGGSASTTFNNLTMNNAAGATLGISELVAGTLTLTNGILTTGTNTITLTGCTGTTITGYSSSSYINGILAQVYCGVGSKVFPIGKGGNYRPLTLAYTALTGTSTVTAEQFEMTIPGTIFPDHTTYQTDRYWSITESGGSGYAFNLTLDGTPFTPSDGDPIILKGDGSTNSRLSATYSSPNFTTSGVTSFSNFAVAYECVPPNITAQPSAPAGVCDGSGTPTFSVTATVTSGSPMYQWQESITGIGGFFSNILNGGVYSGASTSSLTITNPPYSMNGYAYRVIVSRGCGSSDTSNAVPLTVYQIPQGSLVGSIVCSSENGQLTWNASAGSGLYNVIINGNTYSNITSGVPFNANPNPTTTTNYTISSVTSVTGGCSRTSAFEGATATISVLSKVWRGTVSSDWNDASNWCGGIPTSTSDVYIPASAPNQPVVGDAGGVCKNLTTEIGAFLILSISGSNSFEVYGNWENNGTFIPNLSTVTFAGTTTLSGTTAFSFYSVIIGNSSTLTSSIGMIRVKGNFTNNGTFVHNNGMVRFEGIYPQSISGNTSFYNVIFNTALSSVDIIILNPISIQNAAQFNNGILSFSGSGSLTFENGSSQSGASYYSFVNGSVKKVGNTAFTFPVGKDDLFAPIGISAAEGGGSTTDAFTARYFSHNPDNDGYLVSSKEAALSHVSISEYWTLNKEGTNNVDVTLSWDERSGSVTNLGTLCVARWDETKWVSHGKAGITGSVTPAAGTITSNLVMSFSPFTFGSTDISNPLPISLLYFNAECGADSGVYVKWATATEINNEYFTLYRSSDGINWVEVTKIHGAGNSNTITEYDFLDEKPTVHDTFYKLKQTDLNGKSEEFKIISVYCRYNHKKIKLYPNPTSDILNFSFYNEHHIEKPMSILLYNASGQLCYSQEFETTENDNSYTMKLPSNLTPGVYSFHAKLGEEFFYTAQIHIVK